MNKLIDQLDQKLLQSLEKPYPVGLTQGKMGICIYFYHLSRIEKEDKYKMIAGQLLDDILENLSPELPISVENGLAGIALGITHLIKAGFVEGDVNELLEDFDNIIFKRLAFLRDHTSHPKSELLHLLFYLSVRLSAQTDENGRYIFQELIIKTLNNFVSGITDDFFDESYSFSVYHYHVPLLACIFSRLLKQDFYNERIYKILEELELKILFRVPLLHANRLYLLCGILPLAPYMRNPHWKEYADLLRREISLPIIFEREMKNKHIFLSNGLSMVYLLLYCLEKNHPEYRIAYNPQDFYDRIVSSEAWDSLFRKGHFFNIHEGLLNGFPGVRLLLHHIQKQNA
ncbi:MAG: hypothetical protein LBV74_07815 [Tannerella sp.]|jgi:hypothetical protein|nr:hypothetical protein [Tannerella sp.]